MLSTWGLLINIEVVPHQLQTSPCSRLILSCSAHFGGGVGVLPQALTVLPVLRESFVGL